MNENENEKIATEIVARFDKVFLDARGKQTHPLTVMQLAYDQLKADIIRALNKQGPPAQTITEQMAAPPVPVPEKFETMPEAKSQIPPDVFLLRGKPGTAERVRTFHKERVQTIWEDYGHNKEKLAKALDVGTDALQRMLEKFGLKSPLEQINEEKLRQAYLDANYNKKLTAKRLQVSTHTIKKLVDEWGIVNPHEQAVEGLTKEKLRKAYYDTRYNKTLTAELLGVSIHVVRQKLEDWEIKKPWEEAGTEQPENPDQTETSSVPKSDLT